ncbi:MAG: LamB/YcsF family protein [Limnobacter sp.]|nr:LamB/YcsF family protein [Limnobacter sp.]
MRASLANLPLLNADLGEGYEFDEQLFPLLDVANIACGGHAGDEDSMVLACQRAIHFKVQVGAHPSYPDREGFGRRKPAGPLNGLYSSLCKQIETFENIAAKQGLKTRHFKPHGQLYNDAAFDAEMAGLLLRVAKDFPHLSVYVLAGSPLVDWADQEDVDVVEEAFPDRRYQADGRLRPRRFADALIEDTRQVALQAESMVRGEPLVTAEGESLIVKAGTLCLHGDSPQALENARAVRKMMDGLIG